jgi:hypothetical protein
MIVIVAVAAGGFDAMAPAALDEGALMGTSWFPEVRGPAVYIKRFSHGVTSKERIGSLIVKIFVETARSIPILTPINSSVKS